MVKPLIAFKLNSEEQGHFTIESSLVFPVIFITTISLLFMSIIVYQKVITYSAAALTAQRTAFVWDNSHKNPVNGSFYIEEYDDLYWRNFDDSVSDAFHFIFPNEPVQVELAADVVTSKTLNLPQSKLVNAIKFIPPGFKAKIVYSNQFLDRKVSVQLQSTIKVPPFVENLLGEGTINSVASSNITDPVEFIRNINLTRSYLPILSKSMKMDELNEIFKQFRKKAHSTVSYDNYKLSFDSHAAAKQYLQKLVHGISVNKSTDTVGKWRMIDALDSGNIAHQAYFGSKTNNKDMMTQLSKDLEIIDKGGVNGIVWHFFRRKSDSSIGPSPSLEKMLVDQGIAIIIHE